MVHSDGYLEQALVKAEPYLGAAEGRSDGEGAAARAGAAEGRAAGRADAAAAVQHHRVMQQLHAARRGAQEVRQAQPRLLPGVHRLRQKGPLVYSQIYRGSISAIDLACHLTVQGRASFSWTYGLICQAGNTQS